MTKSEAIIFGKASELNDEYRSLMERGLEDQVELEGKIEYIEGLLETNKGNGLMAKFAYESYPNFSANETRLKMYREKHRDLLDWSYSVKDQLSRLQCPDMQEETDSDTVVKEEDYNKLHWNGCRQRAEAIDIELDFRLKRAKTGWLINKKDAIWALNKRKEMSYRDTITLVLRILEELVIRLDNDKIKGTRDKVSALVDNLKPVNVWSVEIDPNVDMSGDIRISENNVIDAIDMRTSAAKAGISPYCYFEEVEEKQEELPVNNFTDVLDAINKSDGNKTEAAKVLGCSRSTVYRRLEKTIEAAKKVA